ncbi:ROK family protein [Lederbergia citrea]|uniref:ROK family protein n=1 Tax=Lederbergia citrea TaxID=2833581 RepID=A0A942US91_9BACI|nr:ROK family protein [Lederbergia citrea]MBS4178926.1 ROK family protein [Lederbergia citrea]MBS4224058.1 ROK family protein [Lederbergia citrea]
MKQYLAFDIGGTQIKYGLVDEAGNIISSELMDTEAYRGGPSIIEKVIEMGKKIIESHRVAGVAISTAGQVDINTGMIVGAGDTIPNYTGVEVRKLVSEALGLPVEVRNDVDCAALGEQWLGGHDVDNFIALTVGTGIGGAIVIDGKMYSGHSFSAGEWGYMLVEGKPFESVASVSGLISLANEYKEKRDWTGKEIFALYDEGDAEIKRAVNIFFKHLAIGISNLIYIFNPEKVIIGGGITARGEQFLQEVQGEVQKYLQPSFYKNTEIVLAKLSNHAGMVGAVYNFITRQNING